MSVLDVRQVEIELGGHGRFLLLEALSGGSTATTYLAHRAPLPVWVEHELAQPGARATALLASGRLCLDDLAAVKMTPTRSGSQEIFEREYRNLNAFEAVEREQGTHFFPRLLHYADDAFVRGERWLILGQEFAPGQPLNDLGQAARDVGLPSLPEAQALTIGREYVTMLSVAQAAGISSFDRKLKDIFWTDQPAAPQIGRLMVIDWNVTEPANVELDIYRFGLLWFELLLGYPPPRGSDPRPHGTEQQAIAFRQLPDWDRLSPGMQVILRTCLHHEAQRRYSSLTALREALDQQWELWRQPVQGEDGLIQRGMAALRSGASRAAITALSVARARVATETEAIGEQVQVLYDEAAASVQNDLRDTLVDVERKIRFGRFQEARKQLDTAISLADDEAELRLMVQRWLYLTEAASRCLDAGLDEAFTRAMPMLTEALAHLDSGRFAEAGDRLAAAAREGVGEAIRGLMAEATIRQRDQEGARLAELRRFADAAAAYDEARAVELWDALPDSPPFHYRRLVRLFLERDPDEAWREAQAAHRQVEEPAIALRRGEEFEAVDEFEQAAQVYAAALRRHPAHADLRLARERAELAGEVMHVRQRGDGEWAVLAAVNRLLERFPDGAGGYGQRVRQAIRDDNLARLEPEDANSDTIRRAAELLRAHFATDPEVCATHDRLSTDLDQRITSQWQELQAASPLDRAVSPVRLPERIHLLRTAIAARQALSDPAAPWSPPVADATLETLGTTIARFQRARQLIELATEQERLDAPGGPLEDAITAFRQLLELPSIPERLRTDATHELAKAERAWSLAGQINSALAAAAEVSQAMPDDGAGVRAPQWRQIHQALELGEQALSRWRQIYAPDDVRHTRLETATHRLNTLLMLQFDATDTALARITTTVLPLAEAEQELAYLRELATHLRDLEDQRFASQASERVEQRARQIERLQQQAGHARHLQELSTLVDGWLHAGELAFAERQWHTALECVALAQARLRELVAAHGDEHSHVSEQEERIERLGREVLRAKSHDLVQPQAPLSPAGQTQAIPDSDRPDWVNDALALAGDQIRQQVEGLLQEAEQHRSGEIEARFRDLERQLNDLGLEGSAPLSEPLDTRLQALQGQLAELQRLRFLTAAEHEALLRYQGRLRFLQRANELATKWGTFRDELPRGDVLISETWRAVLDATNYLVVEAPSDLPAAYWSRLNAGLAAAYEAFACEHYREQTHWLVWLGLLHFMVQQRSAVPGQTTMQQPMNEMIAGTPNQQPMEMKSGED